MSRTTDPKRKCAECGKGGATKANICLGCVVEILANEEPKSPEGKAYLKEFMRRARTGEGIR